MLKICIPNFFYGYVNIIVLNWCIVELRYIYDNQSSEHGTHSVCGCFGVAYCIYDFLFSTENTEHKYRVYITFLFYHLETT